MTRSIVFVSAALAGLLLSVPQAAMSQNTAPDLNGFWTHGFSLGFDPPPEGGAGPVQDFKTKAQMRAMGQFVFHEGNYNNPILQPWVAEIVKKAGEAAKEGHCVPTKQETCFPSEIGRAHV